MQISKVIVLPARFITFIRRDPIFHRLLINSSWLMGSDTVIAGISFLQGIFVTHLLGVEQYGVLGIIMTTVSTAKRLISFRMNEFIVKYMGDAFEQKQNDLAAATLKLGLLLDGGSSLIAFAIACAMTPYFAKWFVGDSLSINLMYMYGYAMVLLTGFIGESLYGVLQTFKQFRQLSIRATLSQLATFIVIIIVFVSKTGIWGVLIAYFIGQAISSITLMILAWRSICDHVGQGWWNTPLSCLKGQLCNMLKFMLYTNIGATLSLIAKDSDALWLGYFRNPAEVGYYKLALTLATMAMMPIAPFARTIYPELTQALMAGEVAKTKRLLKKCTAFASAWVILVFIGAVLLSKFLISHLYGFAFLPAVPALLVLLIGFGFGQIVFWFRPALLALGKTADLALISAGVTVLKIVGVILIVPTFGYIGNAVILSCLYIFAATTGALLFYLIIRKR